MPNIYSDKDIAVLVPTKDRPEKIYNLLNSLAEQIVYIGRIIIVDGGVSVRDIVYSFKDRLPVEHYLCQPPGQIRQRNMGIQKLDEATRLVACVDDDIVFEKDAFQNMLLFWNEVEPETAGVGFNVVNVPSYRYSFLKRLFGASGPQQGQVLSSGYNTSLENVPKSIRTTWLNGGVTVWRKDILTRNFHKEVNTPWAPCEDLIFSYPLGKKYPLYICAEARTRHEHIFAPLPSGNIWHFRGKTGVLWRLRFVLSNEDLSTVAFIWMTLSTAVAGCMIGIFKRDTDFIKLHLGRLIGAFLGIKAIFKKQDLIALLTNENQ